MTRGKNRSYRYRGRYGGGGSGNRRSGGGNRRPFHDGQFSNYKMRGGSIVRQPPPQYFPQEGGSNYGFGPPQNFGFGPRGNMGNMGGGPGGRLPRPPFQVQLNLPINIMPSMLLSQAGGGGGGMRGSGHWWRGGNRSHVSKAPPRLTRKQQERLQKKNAVYAKTGGNTGKSRLMEIDVGITEYVSKRPGFNGIIKQRFSDFHVNEIGLEGNIAKLTDLAPPKDSEIKKAESEIIEILTEEVMEKLKEIVENKKGTVEIEVTEKTKDERRKIHEAVKDGFGEELYSNTIDKGEKKYIQILKTFKGVSQDRRSRWPSDRAGCYVHFILYKENLDTQETVNLVASRLGVKPNFITYAGTKDRRAVTSQWMSAFKVEPVKLAKLSRSMRNMRLGNYSYKPQCLKLGDLQGNRFRICLRNVDGTDEQIQEAMTSLQENGFINYYGLQRFGSSSSVPTPEVGRALLLGDWKQAVELILKPRNTDEPWAVRRARKHWWETRDAKRAAKMLRKNFMNIIESKLLYGLSKHQPNDYVNALESIPRNTRLLYLHSYQSLLWNKIVSCRVKEFGLKPMAGDLVLVEDVPEVVDQEGTLIWSDDFPKRPRKLAKKEAREEARKKKEAEAAAAAAKAKVKKETDEKNAEEDRAEGNAEKDAEGKEEAEEGAKEINDKEIKKESVEEEEQEKPAVSEDTTTEANEKDASQSEAVEENPNHHKPIVRAIKEDELDSIRIEDIVMPLPGHDIILPDNILRKWYEELLEEDGLTFAKMKQTVKQYSVSGTYRRMIIRPKDVSWKTKRYSKATQTLIQSDLEELRDVPPPEDEPDGQYKALILEFSLPSSTYATMALREVLKADTSSLYQSSLNNYHVEKDDKNKNDSGTKSEDESKGSDKSGNASGEADKKTAENENVSGEANDKPAEDKNVSGEADDKPIEGESKSEVDKVNGSVNEQITDQTDAVPVDAENVTAKRKAEEPVEQNKDKGSTEPKKIKVDEA